MTVPGENGATRLYDLTERGNSLRPVLQALYDWGSAMALEIDVRVGERPEDGSGEGSGFGR